jgi:hypothetical protein
MNIEIKVFLKFWWVGKKYIMSYKEEFYKKVGKFNVEELKSFFEKEGYTFDDFKKEYQSWESEEQRYKKRLDRLDDSNYNNNTDGGVI